MSDVADALLSGSSDLETDGAKKSKPKLKSKSSSSSSSRKKSKSSRSKKTSRKGLDDSLKLEKLKRSSQRTSESANSNSNYSGSDDTSGDEFESDLRARRLSGVSRTSSKSSSRDVTSALARSDSALVRWDDEDEDEDKGKDRPAEGELKLKSKSELKSKWKSESESAPTLLPDESDATMTATATTSTSTSTSTMALIKARRMGKQPSPSSFSEPTGSSVNSADALSAAMGKLPQSFTESGKTASDGSRPANKGRISFADEHVGDDEKETSASDDRRRRSENDPSPSTAKPSILKTRFSGQVNSSPSPSSGTSSRPPLPSESETTSFNKSSLTRTKVQRKTSFSDPAAAAASDTERNNRDRDREHELTTSLVSSLVGTITKRHKQLRRSKMSMENQIYVPPKSRRKSIFQAMAHVMAGRTVELVMWTYGASFGKVMLFFLAFYVVNIFVWAGVIDLVDQTMSGGDCIHGDDAASLTATARYELAFELSWSTFTTVGYGAVSPPGGETGCYAIRLVCAFVAFMGILFGSTTAAIMYSKLMRLIAQAHVTFSSTLCVQYGKGAEGGTVRYGQLNFRASLSVQAYNKKLEAALLANGSETNGGKHTADDTPAGSEAGYPVIEFRMMNDRANHEGSEIWDAQISAIVQLHKEQTGTSAGALKNDKVSGGGSTLDLEKKVYYPITLSPNTHPHFSRIWYARHVLNEESPLLKREVRDMIAAEKQWDPDFNSWREIRDCLNPFISLRVTLSGTSAVSASTVFAEHVYEFDDVCVGWRFANMVYEKKVGIYNRSWWRRFGRPFGLPGESVPTEGQDDNPDMKTKVDRDLLHDIVPQPGGDFEPMEVYESHRVLNTW
ncbi:hypothetical protein ACHAXS_001609 [Conticribra weissflogii]